MKIPCIFFLNPPNATRLIKLQEVGGFIGRGLKQVHGVGFGSTLISKSIVEKYVFWYDERLGNSNKHSDVYFYMELHNSGVPVFIDTDVLIEHRPSQWSDVIDR